MYLNRNRIVESLSVVVYHFTYINNLLNILKEDKFQASNTLGSNADKVINKNKFYFFSTQRDKGLINS